MTGYALATALAAPVEDGMMLAAAARPARQSAPFIEPSTVSCEAVAASLEGAEMMTFLAPPSTCFMQPSVVRKAPVDSQTYSTPVSFQGISVGSRVAESETGRPLTTRPPSAISQVPGKRPWTVSCSSRYFMYSGDMGELMCLSTNESRSMAMRTTRRPMRPKPLTPSLMGASAPPIEIGALSPDTPAIIEKAIMVERDAGGGAR